MEKNIVPTGKGKIEIQQLTDQEEELLRIKLIENRMARLLKIAELKEALTPHGLRHTHTSLLAEAGVASKK